jgi:predicted GNAT family acetyltransferase
MMPPNIGLATLIGNYDITPKARCRLIALALDAPMDSEIHDNPAHHRYELEVDGVTAYVLYRRQPGVITFIHTEVPKALGGKGIGSRLARHVLDTARGTGFASSRCALSSPPG